MTSQAEHTPSPCIIIDNGGGMKLLSCKCNTWAQEVTGRGLLPGEDAVDADDEDDDLTSIT